MTALLLLVSAVAQTDSCLNVQGGQITAGALGERFDEFRNIDPRTVFGYAPSPGLTRWIRAQELRGFAKRHGFVLAGAVDVCIQRTAKIYSREEVEAALRGALTDEGLAPGQARLDLVDYCRIPMPAGRLRFRLKELARPAAGSRDATSTWRGHVVFEDHRSTPFWASVRFSIEYTALVAARPIPSGKTLTAEDLREARLVLLAHEGRPSLRIEEILGMETKREMNEGAPFVAQLLARPREVRPGQKVTVRAESAGARLVAEGKAITGGRRGEAVLIENAGSKKRFRAIVAGGGLVTVRVEESDEVLRNSGDRHIH